MTSAILLSDLRNKIADAARGGDFERVTQLTNLAKRVQDIEVTQNALVIELKRIAEQVRGETRTIEAPPLPFPASPPQHVAEGPLTVEIDFPKLGINHPPVRVSERKASETMRRTMEVIAEKMGESTLEPLTQLQINRGPLLSKNPERDFHNSAAGSTYAHQRVGRTSYHVLTHSSTSEKVGALQSAAKMLGIPAPFFRVRSAA